MTKSEIFHRIVRKNSLLAGRDVELSVNAMLKQIATSIGAGRHIEIRGIGSFSLHFRPARVARKPIDSANERDRGCVAPVDVALRLRFVAPARRASLPRERSSTWTPVAIDVNVPKLSHHLFLKPSTEIIPFRRAQDNFHLSGHRYFSNCLLVNFPMQLQSKSFRIQRIFEPSRPHIYPRWRPKIILLTQSDTDSSS